MKLTEAKKNTSVKINAIEDEKLNTDALRFGIEIGQIIKIVEKVFGGPVIIQRDEQQIAIGQELAQKIEVISDF